MFRVLIDKARAAARYLRQLRQELAEAQQYLVPALLLTSAISAFVSGAAA